jgi:phenylpropionate dioxygenase-like ring-hydroxylating dioxygenase large terminal subunit
MAILDHWHPILASRSLKKKAVAGVRLAGHDLVVFRDAKGQPGALTDYCPHRRMKLSMGKVHNNKLQCLYHGWTYDKNGEGESPGTPKLFACARHYEVREEYGAVWVRNPGASTEFPRFDVKGYWKVCNLSHRVKAPLELTVDNFCEIEHTPTTHAFFGYPLDRMQEVQVEFQPTDTSVRVINRGPSKPISLPLRALVGIRKGDEFMDDWTTYFSPVYSVYDHWWRCPRTGRESMIRWRLIIFFVPVDDNETAIFTFVYTKSRYPGPSGGVRFFKWLLRSRIDHEIRLDVRVLEGLADKNPSIEGMKLSRFDRVLGLNRERIERIYRGTAPAQENSPCTDKVLCASGKSLQPIE